MKVIWTASGFPVKRTNEIRLLNGDAVKARIRFPSWDPEGPVRVVYGEVRGRGPISSWTVESTAVVNLLAAIREVKAGAPWVVLSRRARRRGSPAAAARLSG
jgi:hypothetical protein